MSQGSKLKFFYDNMLSKAGGTLSAPTTNSTGDYSINYINNFLEVNGWKERTTAISTSRAINFDAGAGNAYSADYLVIYNHNINAATVVVEASSDNFAASTVAVASFTAGTTAAILNEFSSVFGPYRYWRVTISRSTATETQINIMSLGTKTELDYIRPPFDPYGQEIKANVNLSQGGYVTGIHTRYTERVLQINLSNESTAVYASVKSWMDVSGAGNFIVAWDSTGSSADVWLVRPDGLTFNNPINVDKLRDISINLRGRKLI